MSNLPAVWRERARAMEKYAPTAAQVFQDCAAELEVAERAQADDVIGLREAALYSGFSADALGRQIKAGKLENFGTQRRPKVRRGALPRKPGYEPKGTDAPALDVAALALDARAS